MKRQKAMRRRSEVSSVRNDFLAPNRLGHGITRCASRSNVPRAAARRAPGREHRVQLREVGVLAVELPDGGDRRDRDEVRDQVERAPLLGEPDARAARDEVARCAARVTPAATGTLTSVALARCSDVCSAGVVGWSIGCSRGEEKSRAGASNERRERNSSHSSAAPGSVKSADVNAALRACHDAARRLAVRRVPAPCGCDRHATSRFCHRGLRGAAQAGTVATLWTAPLRPAARTSRLRSDLARCYAARSRRAPACLQSRVRASPSAFDPCEEGLPSWQPLPRPVHRGSVDRMPVCPGNRRSEPDRHSSRLLPAIHGGGAAGGH